MHTYRSPQLPIDERPSITTFTFTDALDVVEYATYDGMMNWRTWPEVWHMDDEGVVQCFGRGSTFSSIREWAYEPDELFEQREFGVATTGCAPRWLINEPRFSWLNSPPVDESDAAAFLELRRALSNVGVQLVDCMLWSDEMRCWSLHELTSGTTRWPPPLTQVAR